jgi:hypothetical protein
MIKMLHNLRCYDVYIFVSDVVIDLPYNIHDLLILYSCGT